MPSHPVTLPSKSFNSKGEAADFFKDMLNRYGEGEELSSLDDQLLFELLQRHPDAQKKIGVGIKKFYRGKTPKHPTSCFHLERLNGTTAHFSYPSCIRSKAPSLDQEFYRACRMAVTEELIAQKEEIFRQSNGVVRCSKTKEIVTIDGSEYRHTTPRFRDIVSDFIQANKIEIRKEMFVESLDMHYFTEFSDPALAAQFVTFHSAHANLEVFKKYER